jgi:hypothetical protein
MTDPRPLHERCICDHNPDTTDGPEQDCPQHGWSDGPPLFEWAKLCSTVRWHAENLARHYQRKGWAIGDIVRYHAGDPSRAEWVIHASREVQP